MTKLTPEQEAAIDRMNARKAGSDGLDAETKARIEAEEAYRAKVRAQQPPLKKRGGCLQIGCGTLVVLFLLLGALAQCSNSQYSSGSNSSSTSSTVSSGALMNECEDAVRARLSYPDEAQFTGAFNVGLNSEITESGSTSTWRSVVKAKNAFGVQSSIGFTCSKSVGDSGVTLIMEQ